MDKISVIGLGFGDCGKGRFVDDLCRQRGAHTVVRFSGGGQAGHTVLRSDGRAHIFSQFGAGTFHAGTRTLLAAPVVIHPGGLLQEAARLAELGVGDALARLTIDARCRVTTPYLQAAGRLRELLRSERHGSCGIGVGETVRLALEAPELSLTYGDLPYLRRCREKLEAQKQALLDSLASVGKTETLDPRQTARVGAQRAAPASVASQEWEIFADPGVPQRWLDQIAPLWNKVAPADRDQVASRLAAPGCVIFEGAQGLLLDEDHGFHPHTTWSRLGPAAVEAVLEDLGVPTEVEHLGVLRAYLTRHGEGPFPTESGELGHLAEPHNGSAGWQGPFRRGQPDAVLLRYALRAAGGKIAGLLVSHLDVFEKASLRWCEAYATPQGRLDELAIATKPDLEHQKQLTRLMWSAQPQYEAGLLAGREELLARITAAAGIPVVLASRGPLPGQLC